MQPRPLQKSASFTNIEELFPEFKHQRIYPHSLLAGDLAGSAEYDYLITPEQAEKLFKLLGPRVRVLTDKYFKPNEMAERLFPGSSKMHTILTLGCGGVSCPEQKSVAKLADRVIAKTKYNVKFFIHSGDLAYPSGADSARAAIFDTTFYRPYSERKYPFLRPLPFRITLGNHELKRTTPVYLTEKVTTLKTGLDVAKYMLMHTHMFHAEDPIIPTSKRTLLRNNELDVKEAPKFGMEYYFGSDIDGKVQYFYINSSTLLNDFLEYKSHIAGVTEMTPEALRSNQFVFLLKTYSECIAAGRIPVLVMHHPLINMGSRNRHYDSHFHNSSKEIKQLDRIFQLPLDCSKDLLSQILISAEEFIDTIPGVPLPTADAENLCLLLARLFASHNMHFRAVLCAHEHMMSVINTKGIPNVSQNYHPKDKDKKPVIPSYQRPDDLSNYPVFQIISGGGGGPLQDPYSWNLGENIGCCIKTNGVCAMTYDPTDPKELTVDLYSVDGLHLQFNDKGPRPIIAKAPLDEEYQKGAILREIINKVCFNYQEFLEKEMKKSGGTFLDPILKSAVKTVVGTMSSFFKGEMKVKTSGNVTHTMNDVLIMNHMQAYVNSHKPIQFTEAIKKLYDLSLKLKNKKSADSFLRDINAQLFDKFDKDLEDLHQTTQNRANLSLGSL